MLDIHLIKKIQLSKFKYFSLVLKKLSSTRPNNFFKVNKFISLQNPEYFETAEEICKIVFALEKKWKLKKFYSLDAYNSLCQETMLEQLYLKKNGTYRAIRNKIDNIDLYKSSKKMKSYLLGLILTQIFWQSHYKILKFYKKNIKIKKEVKFLEIGSGHGLLSKYLMDDNLKSSGVICDISKQSLSLVKNILKNSKNMNKIKFINQDFFKLNEKSKFDFIIMGEVIEHVKDPKTFLKKAINLLQKDGKLFLSTCANCAQVDHIFHFKNIYEIQKLIKSSKLKIKSELITPSENIPRKKWKAEKIAINYCSILVKK
jgi:2-polyprenyl-3-methyl-5-hydroxy-6-metoxy-1,4-benzoquinol methylase